VFERRNLFSHHPNTSLDVGSAKVKDFISLVSLASLQKIEARSG